RIENVTLVDGTGAGSLHGAVTQVEAARIVYAAPGDGAPPNLGQVEVMDGPGGTVLPARIDCHVHFGIGSASKPLTRRLDGRTARRPAGCSPRTGHRWNPQRDSRWGHQCGARLRN